MAYLVAAPFGVALFVAWRQHSTAKKRYKIDKITRRMSNLQYMIRDNVQKLWEYTECSESKKSILGLEEMMWEDWPQKEAAEEVIETIVYRVLEKEKLRRELENAKAELDEVELERERLDPNYRRPSEDESLEPAALAVQELCDQGMTLKAAIEQVAEQRQVSASKVEQAYRYFVVTD